MSNQILVPSLGESITEATVSKWLKQVGEKVDSDEPLVELETDKVNVEVPSPQSGTLSSIKVKEGDTVEVGALLGVINEEEFKITKKQSVDEDTQSYVPPKSTKKKNITKEIISEEKNKNLEEETLTLTEETEETEENVSNGALILDTLVDDEKKEKYIPPKTKKHLSPSDR